MKVRAVVLALFIAAALGICTSRPAAAAPALWVVQSAAGGKLYLFGTVHLLRKETQWRTPELEAAIEGSQDLYLEIADPRVTPMNRAALLKLGFDREHPLSTKISKADVALLDDAAKRYGFGSEAAFEPMQPWLAVLVLSMMPAVHSGYSPASGVDLQIRKDFVDAGKPVHGLETVEMQAHLFADMPEAAQVALLHVELKDALQPKNEPTTDTLVDAWLSGNEDDLASALQIAKLSQTPMFAKLYTDRNNAWASALAARLKQPGTSFVCVGAAHLVGPSGVPTLLAHMGYTVTRVPIAATPAPASQPAVPAPAPAPSTSPIPIVLTPPAGWKPHAVSLAVGPFEEDRMWVDPNRRGAIISGHVDLPGAAAADLDALDAAFHQGVASAEGVKDVQPSTHVKICNGTQTGTYTKLTMTSVKEDVVLTVSDRGYLAQYVRGKDFPDDPAALRSLLSLCAPQPAASFK